MKPRHLLERVCQIPLFSSCWLKQLPSSWPLQKPRRTLFMAKTGEAWRRVPEFSSALRALSWEESSAFWGGRPWLCLEGVLQERRSHVRRRGSSLFCLWKQEVSPLVLLVLNLQMLCLRGIHFYRKLLPSLSRTSSPRRDKTKIHMMVKDTWAFYISRIYKTFLNKFLSHQGWSPFAWSSCCQQIITHTSTKDSRLAATLHKRIQTRISGVSVS